MKGRHLSLRLAEESYEQLEKLARARSETVSEAARRLIEEGRRMAEHPGIVFRDGPTGRRAGLADGPDVWEIIDVFPEWDPDWNIRRSETVGATSVTALQVLIAQRYYADFTEEIDARICSNREAAAALYAELVRPEKPASR